MKIGILGLFNYYMYEEVCAEVLEKKGHEVVRLPFGKLVNSVIGKIEFYYSFRGIISLYYNLRLLRVIKKRNIQIVICWRTTWLYDWVLRKLQKKNVKLISYNNDDPFSPHYANGNTHQRNLWKHFKRQIPLFDVNLVFRPVNVEEYNGAGSKKTELWLPAYIPWRVENIKPTFEKKSIEAIFIGHWEQHREDYLCYLIENGIKVEVYGTKWEKAKSLKSINVIRPLYGDEYFGYLKSAKIAIAFLSKLNRDVYTRRNFEIPACGTFMLSERTDELKYLYKGYNGIDFFSSKEELLDQILRTDTNKLILTQFVDKHSILNRIEELIKVIDEI